MQKKRRKLYKRTVNTRKIFEASTSKIKTTNPYAKFAAGGCFICGKKGPDECPQIRQIAFMEVA